MCNSTGSVKLTLLSGPEPQSQANEITVSLECGRDGFSPRVLVRENDDLTRDLIITDEEGEKTIPNIVTYAAVEKVTGDLSAAIKSADDAAQTAAGAAYVAGYYGSAASDAADYANKTAAEAVQAAQQARDATQKALEATDTANDAATRIDKGVQDAQNALERAEAAVSDAAAALTSATEAATSATDAAAQATASATAADMAAFRANSAADRLTVGAVSATEGIFRQDSGMLWLGKNQSIEMFLRMPTEPISGFQWVLNSRTEGYTQLLLMLYPADEGYSLNAQVNNGGLTFLTSYGKAYHIVLSVNENHLFYYVNGSLVGEVAPRTFLPTDSIFYISNAVAGYGFSGLMFHVRVFNRGLTTEEVTQMWNDGRPQEYVLSQPLAAACVGEYLPQNLQAAGWTDTSGNGNDFVLYGTATPVEDRPCLPRIITAAGAPDVPPLFVGQTCIDTTSKNIYMGAGILSADDWVMING